MKRYSKNIAAFALSVAIIGCSTVVLVDDIKTMNEPDTHSVDSPAPGCLELKLDPTSMPEATGEAEQKPQQLDWHDVVSDDEARMLAQTIYNEAQVLYWTGNRYGVSYPARQAAVAWCALNRLDSGEFGRTLEDVLTRWWAEKNGCNNVGRTLPQGYIYFSGYDGENHFRDEYHTDAVWDWSLPDPYVEDWR